MLNEARLHRYSPKKARVNANIFIAYRKSLGFTQSEFANYLKTELNKIGVSISLRTVRDIENNEEIDRKKVKAIQEFCGFGNDWIFDQNTFRKLKYPNHTLKSYEFAMEVIRCSDNQELVEEAKDYIRLFLDIEKP